MRESTTAASDPELWSPAERDRLVRLCARLSGSMEAAEDLAQETLLEAWRARERLRDPSARAHWLAGIARNVCRRRHSRPARTARPAISALTIEEVELHLSDDIALDIVLERSEVADLLSHALDLLPGGARELLVERYVEDLSVGEIAARRSLPEGTASVRLHRGKRALRRILQTDLREEAVALGLLGRESDEWLATRIWCPCCGGAHLQARSELAVGSFTVYCPACRHVTTERSAGYLAEVTGYWRTLQRVYREANLYYRSGLEMGSAPCACCNRPQPLGAGIGSNEDEERPHREVRFLMCHAFDQFQALELSFPQEPSDLRVRPHFDAGVALDLIDQVARHSSWT